MDKETYPHQHPPSASGVKLEALITRRDAIRDKMTTDIVEFQKCIQELTSSMLDEVKEFASYQIQSGDEVMREIEVVQCEIDDLVTGHARLQQLFSTFSCKLSSIFIPKQDKSTGSGVLSKQSVSPGTAPKVFSTPPTFSMNEDLNGEG